MEPPAPRRWSSAAASPRTPTHRLLLRVHSAEELRHASANGTYCKIYVTDSARPSGTHRSSLKRLLTGGGGGNNGSGDHGAPGPERDSLEALSPPPHRRLSVHDGTAAAPSPTMRVLKTQLHKARRANPVWKEQFVIPVFDPLAEILTIRVKTAKLMTTPVIGTCFVPLRELAGETEDRWLRLLDSSKRPAGRLRLQLRLVPTQALDEDEADDVALDTIDTRLTMPLDASALAAAAPRGSVSQAAQRDSLYRGRRLVAGNLVEARNSDSTAASDSISSDRSSTPTVSPYYPPNNHPSYTVPYNTSLGPPPSDKRLSVSQLFSDDGGSSRRSATQMSRGPMSADELELSKRTKDQLADTGRTRSNQESPTNHSRQSSRVTSEMTSSRLDRCNPTQESFLADLQSVTSPAEKDDWSTRTTVTTAMSSEEELEDDHEAREMTVEFDFDTGDVRPSSRIKMPLRSTTIRSSAATVSADTDEEETEDEPEDDEMDPDAEAEFPRVPLRATITKLLRRESVNVVMDEDEEEEDAEDIIFVEEVPILDCIEHIHLEEIDCT